MLFYKLFYPKKKYWKLFYYVCTQEWGMEVVRKNKLIQPMIITLEWGERVMVSFYKFKLCECKRQIYINI